MLQPTSVGVGEITTYRTETCISGIAQTKLQREKKFKRVSPRNVRVLTSDAALKDIGLMYVELCALYKESAKGKDKGKEVNLAEHSDDTIDLDASDFANDVVETALVENWNAYYVMFEISYDHVMNKLLFVLNVFK